MITELYGLPGAGKSTMIQKLTGGSSTSISSIKGVKKVFIHLIKKIAVYLPSSMGYKSKMHIIMKPYKINPNISIEQNYIIITVLCWFRLDTDI